MSPADGGLLVLYKLVLWLPGGLIGAAAGLRGCAEHRPRQGTRGRQRQPLAGLLRPVIVIGVA